MNNQGFLQNPRPVSRGLKFQIGFLGIDSLYLVIEYPHLDIFKLWSSIVPYTQDKRLFAGIPFDDFVIRKGAHGYKLSLWDGDTRLYITDQVDEKLQQEGSPQAGMGALLQLGTKWLRRYGDIYHADKLIENAFAQLKVFGLQNPERYAVRLNRLDITLDALGLKVTDFSIDAWRSQWVGYAQQKHFYDSAATGQLEGLSIGSSEGVIRFKVYDKIAESFKSGTSLFWRSVWGVDEFSPLDVARFEWSIKVFQGKFTDLRHLTDLTYEKFLDLLNYASLKWGRLCLPDSNENASRRELAPLWAELRRLIEDWSLNHQGIAKRQYHYEPDLQPAYLRYVAGTFAGLMARVGIEEKLDTPASIVSAFDAFALENISLPRKAQEKWELLSRLHLKRDNK